MWKKLGGLLAFTEALAHFHFHLWDIEKINWTFQKNSVVSIGRLTAFYVVLVPVELIPSKPPPCAYVKIK